MQVFNAFLKVMKRRMTSALIYVIVFLAISFSFANSKSQEKVFKSTKLNVAVLDEDNTPESKALTDFIGTKHNLKQIEKDENIIKDALYWGITVDYVMEIRQGFSQRLEAKEYDDLFGDYHVHDGFSDALMEQLLNEYITAVGTYQAAGMTTSDAMKHTADALSVESSVELADKNSEQQNSDFTEEFSAYFRYMPYILLSVLISVLCPVLLAMSRKNIRYRTNCSSFKTSAYTFQIFLGSMIFVIGIWLIFMIAGTIMNGGIFRGKAWLAVLNSFIFSILSAAIAVLIAEFHPSDTAINLATQVIGLGMSFLCGIFVPHIYLSSGVLKAARFMPAYWYVKANNMIAGIDTFSSKEVAVCFLIQSAFLLAVALLAALVHRTNYSASAQLNK